MLRSSLSLKLGFVLLVVAFVPGCIASILGTAHKQIDAAFPPLRYEEASRKAVERSRRELSRMQSAGILLTVPMASIQEGFAVALKQFNGQVEEVEVVNASIEGAEQGLRFTARVRGRTKKPRATFDATLTGWGAVSLEQHTATVQPGLSSAQLESLDLEQWTLFAGPVVKEVNAVLRRYIDNVNRVIPALRYPLDPAKAGLSGEPIVLQVPPDRRVTLPGVKLGAAAVLVDVSGVHVLAELHAVGVTTPSGAAVVDAGGGFAGYRDAFWKQASTVGQLGASKVVGVFVSQALLTQVLAPTFKPVEIRQLQQQALFNVLDALKAEGSQVAAGAQVSAEVLQGHVTQALSDALPKSEELKFGAPTVTFAEQLVQVELPVKGTVRTAQLGFAARVSAAGILAPKGDGLYVRLAIAGLRVDEVEHLGGELRPAPFLASLNQLIDQFVPYVNSAIDDKVIKLPLPPLKPVPVPTMAGIQVSPSELKLPQGERVTVIPRIESTGLRLLVLTLPGAETDSMPLVHDVSLQDAQLLAAQIARGEEALPPPQGASESAAPDVTAEQVNTAFRKRWETTLPALGVSGQASRGVEAVVAMSWITATLNRIFAENALTVTARHDTGKLEFKSDKLSLGEKLERSCVVNTECRRSDCNRDQCNRPPGKCDWSCLKCIRVLGRRICTDEPGCKASRAACNVNEERKVAECNVREESKKGACNVREETALAACRTKVATEKAGCALVNETITAIKGISDIGRFSGDAQVWAEATVSRPELSYDALKGALTLKVDADGSAKVKGDLSFKPYDIGHVLVCATPGSVPFKMGMELKGGRTEITARFRPVSEQGAPLKLEVAFDLVSVRGKLSPSPIDALLTNNPQIFVTCNPVLTGLPTGVNALGKLSAYTPFDVLKALERAAPGNQEQAMSAVRALTTGDLDQEVIMPPLRIDVPNLPFEREGSAIVLSPTWRGGHLFYGMP